MKIGLNQKSLQAEWARIITEDGYDIYIVTQPNPSVVVQVNLKNYASVIALV